jgi:hypothetical protein
MITKRNFIRGAFATAFAALAAPSLAQGPQVPELPGWRPCKITGGRYRFGAWVDIGATADEEEGLEWMGKLFMREWPDGRREFGVHGHGAFMLHDTPASVLKAVRAMRARHDRKQAEWRADSERNRRLHDEAAHAL